MPTAPGGDVSVRNPVFVRDTFALPSDPRQPDSTCGPRVGGHTLSRHAGAGGQHRVLFPRHFVRKGMDFPKLYKDLSKVLWRFVSQDLSFSNVPIQKYEEVNEVKRVYIALCEFFLPPLACYCEFVWEPSAT